MSDLPVPETAITAAVAELIAAHRRAGRSVNTSGYEEKFVRMIVAAAAPHIDAAARASERERLNVPELLIKIDGELTPEALDAIKARFIEAQKHGQIRELAPEPVFEPIADLIAEARASERETIRQLIEQEARVRCDQEGCVDCIATHFVLQEIADLIGGTP